MVSDLKFNVEMQTYIQGQHQTNCAVLNQKGMFDSSGFTVLGVTYPEASEYKDFHEWVTLLESKFTEAVLLPPIQEFKTRCFNMNPPDVAPDCKYNSTTHACDKVGGYTLPGEVFGKIALILLILIVLKELVKLGIVLFMLVLRGGKVSNGLRCICSTSLACPLLAMKGWTQFQNDILMHEDTDREQMWEFVYDGTLLYTVNLYYIF